MLSRKIDKIRVESDRIRAEPIPLLECLSGLQRGVSPAIMQKDFQSESARDGEFMKKT
jgi:hypothetical protein